MLRSGRLTVLSRPLLIAGLACGLVTSLTQAQTPAERIVKKHSSLYAEFADALHRLADEAQRQGLSDPARQIRALAASPESGALNYDDLPTHALPELTPALPKEELAWKVPLRGLQDQYARDLYELARKALRERESSLAFHLIRESAFHSPDNPNTRKMLGFQREGDEWLTPFQSQMRREQKIWHDRFGWIHKDHIDKYEEGLRPYRGNWISVEKDEALRADFRQAWVVESEHFVIKSNHSLQRAVELSGQLDGLRKFFVTEFAEFFATPQQLSTLLNTYTLRAKTTAQKHEIYYFRSREEFIEELRSKQQGVERINGLYLPVARRAYFFANDDDPQANTETLYHEVTHQILSESSRRVFDIATAADFWVVEGIACYMESYKPATDDRPASVGDPQHTRIYWAKHRFIDEDWFLPIAQFTAMGMREFQFPPDYQTAQRYYSQATGLTHFLLHTENGRYRDGLLKYLSAIYSPDRRERENVPRLDQLLGVPFATLDAQYKAYISELETD